jgi:predicted alpha/beta-hydrolase family hydrolase
MDIRTEFGPARARLHPADGSRALLVLGHGAGGGIDSPDLKATTAAAVDHGVSVALVEQPYRVAGRRSPAPARQLDQAWLAVITALLGSNQAAALGGPGLPLLVGGRSSGARVACRTAEVAEASGVICLAFPLHPPGQANDPSKSRQGELDAAGVPTLVIQGEKDPFGMPASDRNLARSVVVVPGTHTLTNQGAVRDEVGIWLTAWLAVAVR